MPALDTLTCAQLATLYTDALAAAKSCGCDGDCSTLACDGFCCTCSTFVNPNSATYAWLDPIMKQASTKLCIGACPLIVCALPTAATCQPSAVGGPNSCVDK